MIILIIIMSTKQCTGNRGTDTRGGWSIDCWVPPSLHPSLPNERERKGTPPDLEQPPFEPSMDKDPGAKATLFFNLFELHNAEKPLTSLSPSVYIHTYRYLIIMVLGLAEVDQIVSHYLSLIELRGNLDFAFHPVVRSV